MAKPELLLNGKPVELPGQITPTTRKIKQFLDKTWALFNQAELSKETGTSKDSVGRFQFFFPHYRIVVSNRSIYGSPGALAAYHEKVKELERKRDAGR